MASKRIGEAVRRYFEERDRMEREVVLHKSLAIIGFGTLFLALRLALIYMVLDKVDIGAVGWVIFWAQVPMFLFLDFIDRWTSK